MLSMSSVRSPPPADALVPELLGTSLALGINAANPRPKACRLPLVFMRAFPRLPFGCGG